MAVAGRSVRASVVEDLIMVRVMEVVVVVFFGEGKVGDADVTLPCFSWSGDIKPFSFKDLYFCDLVVFNNSNFDHHVLQSRYITSPSKLSC